MARFSRKTEHFPLPQLNLFHEDIDSDISALEAQLDKIAPVEMAPTKRAPKRRPLPANLPREEIHLTLDSNDCPQCGEALRFLRDEVNETLDYIPAKFIVRRTVRPQYSCACCQTVHSAALPAQVIDKGQAAPGLLTHVVISKCLDHLPLHRQHQQFLRADIDIPTSTVTNNAKLIRSNN